MVSIHASAREATSGTRPAARASAMFRSTPPRGRRQAAALIEQQAAGFDPRLRAGGDVLLRCNSSATLCFDPRLRAGGDRATRAGHSPCTVSIHASAREATRNSSASAPITILVSIHASAREATHAPFHIDLAARVSIHASAREATDNMIIRSRHAKFRSTPPRGRRLSCSYHYEKHPQIGTIARIPNLSNRGKWRVRGGVLQEVHKKAEKLFANRTSVYR